MLLVSRSGVPSGKQCLISILPYFQRTSPEVILLQKYHVAGSVSVGAKKIRKDVDGGRERANRLCHRAYLKCASGVIIKAGTTFAKERQSRPKSRYWHTNRTRRICTSKFYGALDHRHGLEC